MAADWIVTQMRPGRDPFRALDMALRPLLDPYPTASEHLKGISQGLLYEAAITSQKSMACAPGVAHEIEDSSAGAQRVAADMILHCKLPTK